MRSHKKGENSARCNHIGERLAAAFHLPEVEVVEHSIKNENGSLRNKKP